MANGNVLPKRKMESTATASNFCVMPSCTIRSKPSAASADSLDTNVYQFLAVHITEIGLCHLAQAFHGVIGSCSCFGHSLIPFCFWVVCQLLSLIELEKGHFARYFKKFFNFFQKHLAKHTLPDSKDRRTWKCVRLRLPP